MSAPKSKKQNKPALGNPLPAPSRSRRVATNLNLNRRGAPGSGCQASTFGEEVAGVTYSGLSNFKLSLCCKSRTSRQSKTTRDARSPADMDSISQRVVISSMFILVFGFGVFGDFPNAEQVESSDPRERHCLILKSARIRSLSRMLFGVLQEISPVRGRLFFNFVFHTHYGY
jgi:hypothetical protein